MVQFYLTTDRLENVSCNNNSTIKCHVISRCPKSPSCPEWPDHSASEPCYMDISTRCELKAGFINADRMQFWQDIRQQLEQQQQQQQQEQCDSPDSE